MCWRLCASGWDGGGGRPEKLKGKLKVLTGNAKGYLAHLDKKWLACEKTSVCNDLEWEQVASTYCISFTFHDKDYSRHKLYKTHNFETYHCLSVYELTTPSSRGEWQCPYGVSMCHNTRQRNKQSTSWLRIPAFILQATTDSLQKRILSARVRCVEHQEQIPQTGRDSVYFTYIQRIS